jgi:DNA-binding response OmpR family regulator
VEKKRVTKRSDKTEMTDCFHRNTQPGEVNGYQVCEKLKQANNEKNPYVMLLTARGQKSDLEEGRRVGADSYLVKPFSPLELIKNVENALA